MANLSILDKFRAETSLIAYIDLANVFHWQQVLKWNFRIEDVLSDIFRIPGIKEVKIYFGLNEREPGKSEALHKRIRKTGAILKTKPVKYIRKTIDETFFVRRSTLRLFDPETTTLVQSVVAAVQASGTIIEEPKCNFDVEIAMDLMDDAEKITGIILFSGDSDFYAPLERLRVKGKRVYVVGVRGQVASELFTVANSFVDFGKLYTGVRYRQKSENPAEKAGPRES